MAGMKAGKGGIIANPNCSTIIALMAVTPLHRAGECAAGSKPFEQVCPDSVLRGPPACSGTEPGDWIQRWLLDPQRVLRLPALAPHPTPSLSPPPPPVQPR